MVGVRCILVLALLTLPVAVAGRQQAQAPPRPAPPPQLEVSTQPTVTVPAQVAHPLNKAELEAFFDGIIPLQLERSDVAGAAVLIMKDGQVLLKKGYGYSDITKKKPVDPDITIFRLASISKLFTWISVMQLAEQGKVDIDADVNNYLDFAIAPAFGKFITLRNLMTHTGGFEEEVRDIIVTDPKLAMPLRDFLVENQPRRMYPPGTVPGYSNYGVGLGGYVVQRVSHQAFEQYVTGHIFQPLGMKHSSFHEPLTQELAAFASDGYKSSTEEPAVGFEIFNPAPAGGISSTASDMGRFAQALLNGGELEGQRILKPETLNAMWTRQFAASNELPAVCMGFFQLWRNGLHFLGHGGDLVAFHSFFAVEPKEKLALFVSYNSAGSEEKTRSELLNGFTDRYYPYTPAPAFQKFAVEDLDAISGTYQPTRRADSTKLKLGDLFDQSHAGVDKNGVLKVDAFHDLRGHEKKFKPLGKDLWQEEDGQDRIFAIRDTDGKVVRVAFDFAGVQFERVPWYEKDWLVLPFLGASLLCLIAVVVASVLRLGRRLFLKKRPVLQAQPGTLWLTAGPRLSAFAWVLVAGATATLTSVLESATLPPSHRVDKYFVLLNVLTALAIVFSVFAVAAGLRIWRRADVRLISRVKFTLVAAACAFLIWFAVHWNLIGPAHRY